MGALALQMRQNAWPLVQGAFASSAAYCLKMHISVPNNDIRLPSSDGAILEERTK